MPIYCFVCPHCDHQFEKVQKMDDGEYSRCPNCGMTAERGVEIPSPFRWGKGGPFVG